MKVSNHKLETGKKYWVCRVVPAKSKIRLALHTKPHIVTYIGVYTKDLHYYSTEGECYFKYNKLMDEFFQQFDDKIERLKISLEDKKRKHNKLIHSFIEI